VLVALVAGIALLSLPAFLVTTRRVWRSIRRGAVASDAGLASPADALPARLDAEPPVTRAVLLPSPNGEVASDVGLASPNGSRPHRHDLDIPATRPVLRPTPDVEIASLAGLAAANGSAASHDEERSSFETLGYSPTHSESQVSLEKRCAITWWRGYVRSQFVASEAGASGPIIVAESPPFRWRSNTPPPETEEFVAAHRQLMSSLSELGWEAVESGPAWFEVEFHLTPVASVST